MKREVSLDIFRGLTLAAMILVNTPGSWSHIYAPLKHAAWHGMTPTDLIFPFFLFVVGAAMFHSMSKFQGRSIPWGKIGKRTALLFLIGVGLNAYPFTHSPDEWRIMGVLQRIALCYCVASILILTLSKRQLYVSAGLILLAYWGLMLTVDAPWQLQTNLVRTVDLTLLGSGHMYQGFGLPFDPEGLLSTLPAVVTVLAGYFTSSELARLSEPLHKCRRLLVWASLSISAGLIWSLAQPVNKALWTGSYVLVTAGCAWLLLSLIIYAYDIKGWQKGFGWMAIYGTNPLFIYVLSWIYAASLAQLIRFDINGQTTNAYQWIFDGFNHVMSAKNASLLFALIAVGLFYTLSHWLYQKRIFIKL
ncbi:Alpha-N-acetylglucosaminidase [Saliniradius amylolyticus]|uniref:Alpha-N-acetylglucosaminidase n=1 Tax=Saliniradius amylolyticus TaxID=2183582 RepID=A0A2S2E2V5_9ALTE|nr:heparan-alpha-glucosaminide N-acetyltransferase domain-containing protein [Saliniradius amylolyticus]AWL11978.1 Alpha-N-acetylglucosaminidase [Saliniradius amylolyticus]